MGFGDVLMAAGLAEHLFMQDPSAGPVAITDLHGSPRWSDLWAGNPAITTTPHNSRSIRCGAGCLPYLNYPRPADRLSFSSTYRAQDYRGHIHLTADERARGEDVRARYGHYVVIEPFPLDRKNSNRQWPADNWERLVTRLQRSLSYSLVQFDHPHVIRIPGVPAIASPTFRDACGIIASAHLLVCLEGGLAFAAAALMTPAVVLWGGCISAPVLAYPEHVNLVDDDPATPCGMLYPCDHCMTAWHKISPQRVANEIQRACVTPRAVYGAA